MCLHGSKRHKARPGAANPREEAAGLTGWEPRVGGWLRGGVLPGGKQAQGTQIREAARGGVTPTETELLDLTVPEASHLWTSHFHKPVNSPFCKSHFQMSFSHRQVSRLILGG